MHSVSEWRIDVVCEYKSLLAEGPVWDYKRGVICWIDILNGCIYEYSPGHQSSKKTQLEQMIGSFALCTNGNFIAALRNGFAFIDRETGKQTMITNPEDHLPNNRFNDGKCDPAGRFWAGTMSLSEDPGAGSLYVLEKNLTCTKKISGVTISNGMSWSPDRKTFYYTDTPTLKVAVFDYDEFTGAISNRRTIIRIDEKDGYPDGMTIDSEGMLWIAHWNGWQITRWNPDTGVKLLSVKLPVAKVTSCTFGGLNADDLYITSAKVDLTKQELREQPLAGSVFVIKKSGFKGLPLFEFKV